MRLLANLCSVFPLAALAVLAGCGVQTSTNAVHPNATGVAGNVHGGQQPVGFSTIQLYTVGTTGDGSPATPLLTQTVMSDADGNFTFNFPNAYSCTNATLVYVTATGGDPIPGTANPNLAMMAALGPCSALTSGTFISLNELTTVAAVSALAPFMTSYSAVGSGPGDVAALTAAFGVASELADSSTGQSPGTSAPAGLAVQASLIDTLGNVVAACVNSAGGVAGQSNPCGQLFSYTTPAGQPAPTDTIGALIYLAENPTLNTAGLFGLIAPGAPFQGQLTTAPPDFNVGLVAAPLLLNPLSVSFAATPLGGAESQSVTLANTTTVDTPIAGIGIGGPAGGDFVQTNDCPVTLAKGSFCTIQIVFAPGAATARTGVLSVNAGGTVTAIPLAGSGVASSAGPVALSTTSLTFYERQVAQPVTLTNYGTAPLGISAIQFSSPNYTQENNCGSSLSGQSVCTIYVSAGAAVGNFTGTMTVVDSDTTDAQTVSLATFAPYSQVFDFHIVPLGTNSVAVNFSGGVFLSQDTEFSYWGISTSLGGPDGNDWTAPGCEVREPVGSQYGMCSFYAQMHPFVAGTLYSLYTDTIGDNLLFKGYGAGGSAEFVFSQPTLDFGGSVTGGSYTRTVGILNASTATVTITSATPSLSVGAANNSEFTASISSCSGGGLTMVPAALLESQCQLTITFNPNTLGPRSTTLTVSTTGGLSHSIFVTGNGTYAAPSAPAQVNLGNVQVGAAGLTSVTVTLPNQHPATAQIVEAGSPFSIPGAAYCAQGAATCQFGVTFSPTALGSAQAHLVVTDTVSGLTVTSVLSGIGGVPVVSLSPPSLTFIARTVGSQSIGQPVTLTNMGNAALTFTSIAIGGTDVGDYGQTNNCPASLAINASCTITVTNTPTKTGPSSASVVIVSNASSSPDAIGLSGSGT